MREFVQAPAISKTYVQYVLDCRGLLLLRLKDALVELGLPCLHTQYSV